MFTNDTGWYPSFMSFRRELSCPDNRTGIHPYLGENRYFRAVTGSINGVWWGIVNEVLNSDSESRRGEDFATKQQAVDWCWTNLQELVMQIGA